MSLGTGEQAVWISWSGGLRSRLNAAWDPHVHLRMPACSPAPQLPIQLLANVPPGGSRQWVTHMIAN